MNQLMTRPITFGRGGAIIRASKGESLDMDVIKQYVPAVFATEAHESRSERFVPIPTSYVLEAMLKEGFKVVEARQGGSRIEGKREFTKHRLRLRHANDPTEIQLGIVVPEVILTNGNDGTGAWHLEAGLFRYLCTNGMFVAGPQFVDQKIRHSGNREAVVHQVLTGAFDVIGEMPIAIEAANEMRGHQITGRQASAFAMAALSLRWSGETPEDMPPIQPSAVLAPRRRDDAAMDMWSVFNTVQENMIKGGMAYQSKPTDKSPAGQHRKVSPVHGIDADRSINRALWILAEAMKDARS